MTRAWAGCGRLAMVGRVTAAEYRRYLGECRTYWPGFLTQAVTTVLIFAVFFALSEGARSPTAWFGYLMWILASAVISEAPVATNSEKLSGTLAQVMIKPIGIGVLTLVKTVVWVSVNLVFSVATLAIMAVVLRLPVAVDARLVPLALLGLISLLGFTLVLTALTVLWSKSSGLVGIVSYILLFLTGAMVPLEALPVGLRAVGLGLPLTGAIGAGRGVLSGQSVGAGEVVAMALEAAGYVLLGGLVFRLVMRRAKRRGVSMHY